MMTWQVNGETQAVAPVKPIPPHWPYCAAVPPEDVDVDPLELVVPVPVIVAETDVEVAAIPPEGCVVGTVEG